MLRYEPIGANLFHTSIPSNNHYYNVFVASMPASQNRFYWNQRIDKLVTKIEEKVEFVNKELEKLYFLSRCCLAGNIRIVFSGNFVDFEYWGE